MDKKHLIKNYSQEEFTKTALEIFRFQAQNVAVYKDYLRHIGCDVNLVDQLEKIPFLPITFFKSHSIISGFSKEKLTFFSSGTTNQNRSKHLIANSELYKESFSKGFEYFFGDVTNYVILALLPSYLEQGNSSLVYMVNDLINESKNGDSGFYLNNYTDLLDKLETIEKRQQKALLIGVSYALLDLIEMKKFKLNNTMIMETGGMKGRRNELIKSELHTLLQAGFGVEKIYSEYGMTELLSQAYSLGGNHFKSSPWMKILIREMEDPYTFLGNDRVGGINVIDFANYFSCSFIETQDLGKTHENGTFEVLGRFDNSDIRGCNLMIV